MKAIKIKRNRKPRRIWIPVLVAVLLAAAGGGYWYWTQRQNAAQVSAGPDYSTSVVRAGSITIAASGSGTLIPADEQDLSFSTSGTLAEVDVQAGDTVAQGQVLAKLANLSDLQDGVDSAQQDLAAAQQELDTLQAGAAANLASAQLDAIDAQKAVTDAKSGLIQPGWARCDKDTTDAYYAQYVHARDYLASLGDGGGSQDYYLNVLLPQKNIVARAQAAYEACARFTQYEIDSSHANLSLAQANLKTAQDRLDLLNQNGGLDPLDLAAAQNKVDNAQLALDQAKEKLDGGTLKAPFAGTVLSVAGKAGDEVDTAAFITVADLAHPQVEFSVDETDMDKVAVGETAAISFDAVPDRTFTGKVTRIYPELVTSGGYQVLQGLIQVDLSGEKDVPTLPKGLNASVELVQASAQNVLLVPVQALIDLGDNSYGVMVVGAQGKPRMKVVEVGLQDAASAEIKSGLSAGDVVTTGSNQASTTGSSSSGSTGSSSSGSAGSQNRDFGGGFLNP